MHGGPIDPDRIQNTRSSHPTHPERRTPVGAMIFVGVLAWGILAVSYPIAMAIALGFVAGTVWNVRWVFDRLRTADGWFPEWNEPETIGERLETLIPR